LFNESFIEILNPDLRLFKNFRERILSIQNSLWEI